MRFHRLAVLLCGLLLAACSPTSIDTKRFTDRDLSGISHYAWYSNNRVEAGMKRINSVAMNELIRAEVARALEARGLAEASAGQADVLIGYRARFDNGASERGKGRYHESGDPFEVDSGGVADTGNRLPGAQPPRIHDYDEGKLAITIYDAKTREPLWEGRADVLLPPAALGEPARRDDLREVIGRLFAKFPAGK